MYWWAVLYGYGDLHTRMCMYACGPTCAHALGTCCGYGGASFYTYEMWSGGCECTGVQVLYGYGDVRTRVCVYIRMWSNSCAHALGTCCWYGGVSRHMRVHELHVRMVLT